MTIEKRIVLNAEAEMRVEGEGEQRKITGYAAVFNRKSENLGYFEEVIKPGAFKDVLSNDVRALYNHDSNYVLGRTTSGTLTLEENNKGLKFTAIPPDTQWARDLLTSIERGDVSQCSFSFTIAKGGETWTETNDDKPALREITQIGRLYDVGPVTFPAYPQTSVQARSLLMEAGFDFEGIIELIARAKRGLPVTDSDRDLINSATQILQSYIPEDRAEGLGEQDSHKDGDADRLELVLRELELVEIKNQLKKETN